MLLTKLTYVIATTNHGCQIYFSKNAKQTIKKAKRKKNKAKLFFLHSKFNVKIKKIKSLSISF